MHMYFRNEFYLSYNFINHLGGQDHLKNCLNKCAPRNLCTKISYTKVYIYRNGLVFCAFILSIRIVLISLLLVNDQNQIPMLTLSLRVYTGLFFSSTYIHAFVVKKYFNKLICFVHIFILNAQYFYIIPCCNRSTACHQHCERRKTFNFILIRL